MALDLIGIAILIIFLIIGIVILVKIGGLLLRILLHAIFGWILLFLVNLFPYVNIPINILTILVTGFGGVFGVVALLIAQFLGFI
ncbi:pro-sigmaK processing inhibitor BofA family protein [Methanobacterium oryzae]|uniref:pro-sigmaK processing inhibitor BofA family protein n=1 Tax=Methanobacterium oryzae TaxID=69540 RepID=UPI003D20A49C